MRERPPLPPGPYLVAGLARSGAAAARALLGHGQVLACDSGRPEPVPGVELHAESDGLELVGRARTLVKSPGVPAEAPVVRAARERGLEIVGELEIGWRLVPGSFVAVTGTNGKTTTTELLGAMHRRAGVDVAVAGNVGTPLSSLAGTEPAVVVCECSSFQLEDSVAFAPECALLLNIEEDHIDRHGTLAAYREAKLRAFANQRNGDVAVLPEGFGPVPGAGAGVSFGGVDADLAESEGRLMWRGEPLVRTAEIRLRGRHNVQNAMGAAAAALAGGLEPGPVAAALREFAGVPHRLEEVADRDGVLYVNDSKATNVASATVGIDAFGGGVHVILGGSLKGGGFEGLREVVRARCRAAYLIGEAARRLSRDLDGVVRLEICGHLEAAVAAASRAARPGEVVLLSPACASYDQYSDYEERGEHFRALAGG